MEKNIKLSIIKKNTDNHHLLENIKQNNYIKCENKINETLILFNKPEYFTINQLINKYKIFIFYIIIVIFILFYLIKIRFFDFFKYT